MKVRINAWVLVAFFIAGVASGQVDIPAAINYQGKLTNPTDGRPVASGVYHVEFRVWGHPTSTEGSYAEWGRSFPVHVVTNGLFNVLITDDGGELTNPVPQTNDLRQAFQGSDRYLGLKITQGPSGSISAPEISPRQRLVSAPYAMHAQNSTEAYHAELADDATLARDSANLGGKAASNYYDYDKFDALGLHTSYLSILGWKDGGSAHITSLYDFGGNLCLGAPTAPPSGVKLLVKDGKIQAEDGIIVLGTITPKEGDSSSAGIEWPAGSDGGSGDQGWIRYYGTSGNGTLEIGAGNDGNDKIRIQSSGGIEIAAGEALLLKNSETVEVLGDSHAYDMNTWYRASGDGMVTFHGYKGHMNYWQQTEGGTWITADQGRDHWEHFFNDGGADTLTMTMPVAKGDRIKFDPGSQGPANWHICWRGFGNARLVED